MTAGRAILDAAEALACSPYFAYFSLHKNLLMPGYVETLGLYELFCAFTVNAPLADLNFPKA